MTGVDLANLPILLRPTPPPTSIADFSTRLSAEFSGVPMGTDLYVVPSTTNGTPQAVLIDPVTGQDLPPGPALLHVAPDGTGRIFLRPGQFDPEVTQTVVLNVAAKKSGAAAGVVKVVGRFQLQSAVGSASTAEVIPRFSSGSSTPAFLANLACPCRTAPRR